jgi:hypothetical protein
MDDLRRYEELLILPLKGAAVVVGLCGTLSALFAGCASIPTTKNVPHLKRAAAAAWSERGYGVVSFTNEVSTSMGFLSMYDLKIGGGAVMVNLTNVNTGEPAVGTMSYDTAGLLNLHIVEPKPQVPAL